MKNYDLNIKNGVHTVKITLQAWEYFGHIIYTIGGNCKGRTIINFDFEDYTDGDEFPNNDCQMEYDEYYEYFRCVLSDLDGNKLKYCNDAEGMNNLIVATEIIKFEPKEDSGGCGF